MIKLGEIRINPVNIIKYYPGKIMDNPTIVLKLIDGESEEIFYNDIQKRDEMLELLDKYLIAFDDGVVTMPDLHDIPMFTLGGQGPTEGPGGISIQ